jgi:hypothetical protein
MAGNYTLSKQLADLKAMDGMELSVGWFDTDVYPPNPDRNKPGGIPVAQVVYWNEFGTKTAPARPAVRTAVADGEQNIKEKAKELSKKVVSGQISPETALGKLGGEIEGMIVDSIKDGDWEPNSDITVNGSPPDKDGNQFIKGKGFNKPLIDSGREWQSVAHKVSK